MPLGEVQSVALIEIGSKKQLFVDDYLIESMSDCMRVMNRAEKVEHNPVIRPEHPWEGNDVGMGQVGHPRPFNVAKSPPHSADVA